jgi:hypothetical protein
MDGPGISAASDLRLLFIVSTHFRGHLANSAQNKDITMLIEAMCNAAQERLEQSASPPSTTLPKHVDFYNARLENNLSAEYHQDRSQGFAQLLDHTWNFNNRPPGDVQLGFGEFPGRLLGSEENPTFENERDGFN